MRLFHRQHGVITILLTIILVPVLTANSVLVEMIRYRSASQLLDMVAGNAILSAMADYNEDLYKYFGLLAMEGNHESDVKHWVEENINGSGNSFSRVVNPSTLSVQTTGLYSLNDVNVLKSQIMETEKLSGPFYLAEGIAESILGYDDLFEELGDMFKDAVPGVGLIQNLGKTADSMGDAANKGLDYAEQYEKWENAKAEYEAAHSAYIDAINGILDDYETENPDGQTDPDALQGRQSELTAAESRYLGAIDGVVSQGEKLADCAKDFAEQCSDSVSKITETVTDQLLEDRKTELKEQKKTEIADVDNDSDLSKEQKDRKKKEIEDKYTGLENAAKVENNAPQSAVNIYKSITDSVGEVSTETIKTNLSTQAEALKNEITAFDEYGYLLVSEEREVTDSEGHVIKDENGNIVTETYYVANSKISGGDYYKNIGELTAGADASVFVALWTELNKNIDDVTVEGVSLITLLKASYALVTTLLSSVMFYDLAANGQLNNEGALPSRTMTDSVSGFATGDEVRVESMLEGMKEAAAQMGYDINKLYPASRGQSAELAQEIAERINRIIDTIRWLMGYVNELTSILRGNVLGLLKAVTEIGDATEKIGLFVEDAVFLAEHMGETFETAMKLLYEGAMLNGYVINHFTSRYDITAANRVNGLEGYKGTCFKFAKAEYVLAGNSDEKENQENMSVSLYILRLLLNIVPVLTSSFVAELASAAGPFCWVVYIAVIALETVLDVSALQGFQVKLPIYKIHIFFSPETFPKICEELPGIAAKIKFDNDHDKNIGILTGMVKDIADAIYKDALFKFNYEDYLWLRLCFVPNDVKVKRIADLIYMDMIQEHADFSLDNQYTWLRVEINADHSSVMPMTDALDIAKLRTIKYGGY